MGIEVGIGAALAAGAAGGGAAAAATAAALTFGGIAGSIAVSLAISGAQYALQRALAPGQKNTRVNDPGVSGNTRQAVPPQRIVYGKNKVGGSIFFLDDTKPPYLYLGVLISKRPINNFLTVKIGTTEVKFDSLGNCVTTGYVGKVFASFRDGDPDQAIDTLIHADFPNIATTFRQRGIATAVFKFYYGADREEFDSLWGNVLFPNPLVTLEGCPVYDPRDPTQDRDDATTWKYTNNATLIQTDWARQPYGVNADVEKADWDKIAENADYDDGLIGLKDGTFQKRFTIDGVVTLDQSPRDVMEAMLTANRGQLVISKGRWWLTSSKPRPVVKTIHDGIVVGASSFRSNKPLANEVNEVSVNFIEPDRYNQPVDGPLLTREDYIEADGQVLAQNIQLPFTLGNERAQKLQKAYLDESRLGKALNERVSLDCLGLNITSCVRRDSRSYSSRNGIYIPSTIAYAPDFSALDIQLVEYDPEINGNWNPAVDQQDFTLPPLDVS